MTNKTFIFIIVLISVLLASCDITSAFDDTYSSPKTGLQDLIFQHTMYEGRTYFSGDGYDSKVFYGELMEQVDSIDTYSMTYNWLYGPTYIYYEKSEARGWVVKDVIYSQGIEPTYPTWYNPYSQNF